MTVNLLSTIFGYSTVANIIVGIILLISGLTLESTPLYIVGIIAVCAAVINFTVKCAVNKFRK